MTRTRAVVAWLAAAILAGPTGHAQPAGTPAWAIVDWSSGAVVAGAGLERLREPAQPGSILKIATLVAALESGLATSETRVPCPGEARVDGELVRCSHPRVRHPLRPAEALALSCNVWFATIGARLSRPRLDATLVALGLPPSPRRAPMPLAATGLRAAASPPLAWLEALRRLSGDPPPVPMAAGARALLLDGLRGAALYGSAAAFSDRGMDALAKTGTADQRAGGALGAVIAAWPSVRPTRGMVLVGAGIAGRDAADLAARLASSAAPASTEAAPSVPAPTPPRPPRGGETTLRVGFPGNGGVDVRVLDIEEYVARVLAGEAAPRSPEAALAALAIAARTFALRNRGRHDREGFDLCTLTHCQVLREPYPAAHAAAERTRGQRLLTGAGETADVYYTASCGGRTEKPSSVWTKAPDPAYLPSRADRACDGEPRWAAEIPVRDLERALRSAGYRGSGLRDVEVKARSGSNRATVIALGGFVPSTISGQDFRMLVGRTLGWHLLKSTAFDVRRTGGGYRFDGRGFGHGIGMCVLGSVNRASRGADTRTILEQYFPGLIISARSDTRTSAGPASPRRDAPAPRTATPHPAAASGAVVIALPSASEPERTALAAFLAQSMSELSRKTGVASTGQLRVVVHPSADSFRRETGEPWWSAGRTRGTRVDLLPLAVLRSRGTVEAVVKHELVHVLTDTRLAGRPLWVREGVAMHFAGERPPASLLDGDVPRRVKCPSDDELSRAVSAAAAREAYARAAACVARAIAEGRDWHAIP